MLKSKMSLCCLLFRASSSQPCCYFMFLNRADCSKLRNGETSCLVLGCPFQKNYALQNSSESFRIHLSIFRIHLSIFIQSIFRIHPNLLFSNPEFRIFNRILNLLYKMAIGAVLMSVLHATAQLLQNKKSTICFIFNESIASSRVAAL